VAATEGFAVWGDEVWAVELGAVAANRVRNRMAGIEILAA
jgi:hypothetical protein